MSSWRGRCGGISDGQIWSAAFALLTTLIAQMLSVVVAHAQATGPVVTSVSVPTPGYYQAGDGLSFIVNFDQAVLVDTTGGTPSLSLTIGSITRHAGYVGGSGTNAIAFTYTVASGDVDADGILLGSGIVLNGGALRSAGGDPAALTLNNSGTTSGILVNANAPVVLSTGVIGNPPPNASSVTFEIMFSEGVTDLSLSDLELTRTGTANATLSGLQTSDNITYRVTATGISGSGTLRLDLPAGRVVDGDNIGNPAYTSGTPWTVGPSSDADLTQLLPSEGTLTPAFDPGVLTYSIFLANDVTEITLVPTASEPNATITVNGTAVASGGASAPVFLAVGSTTIDIVVTAQDGTTKTYQVNVTRAAASSADLTGLVPSAGTLSPAFNPTTFAYDLSLGNAVDSITLTPTAADAAASITVNGSAVASGTTSAPLPLSEGTNQFSVVVRAQDGVTTRSYTVSVVRSKPVPTAASRTIQVIAGTTVSVDLTEGASGAPFTAATLTSVPDPGAGTVHLDAQRKRLTFDASPTFAGSAGVGFTLSNATGTSSPATITLAVIARPDPSKDLEVIGLLRAQTDSAKRVAQYQTRNFNNRLEQLHDEGERRRNSLDIRLGYRQAHANDGRTDEQRQLGQMDSTNSTTSSLLGFAAENLSKTDPETASRALEFPGPYLGSYAVWAGGFVDFTERDQGGLDIGSTAVGVSAGVDYRFSERFIGGFGVGYGYDKGDVGDNGTESRASAYSAAIYGSYKPLANLFLDGLIGGSWLDLNSDRFVAATGDFASGDRSGRQIFGSLTAAYEFRDRKWLISPYGRFDLSRSWLDGFAEKGGGIYGLTYGDQTVDAAAGVLGIRASYAFDMNWGTLTPGLRAEFTHDFAGSSRARLGYTDIGTLPYTFETEEAGDDYATLGFSLDAALLNDWALGFEYRTALGSGRRDHAVGLRLGARF